MNSGEANEYAVKSKEIAALESKIVLTKQEQDVPTTHIASVQVSWRAARPNLSG